MNEQLWDDAYDTMMRAFDTGEPMRVGNAVLSFTAVLDHLMIDGEPQAAFLAMMKQNGDSVRFMCDLFKHKCAKAYANWATEKELV